MYLLFYILYSIYHRNSKSHPSTLTLKEGRKSWSRLRKRDGVSSCREGSLPGGFLRPPSWLCSGVPTSSFDFISSSTERNTLLWKRPRSSGVMSRPRLSRAGFIEMPAHSPSSTFLWVELPWVFQSQNRWNWLFSRNSYHLFDCQHFAHCTMHLIQDLQTALELSIPFSVLKKKKENLSFINRYTTALLEDGLQNICFWVLGRRRGKYSCC